MDLHSKQLWRKTAFMGVFLALAMICSYIEMLIPFDFGIPGVKLGLTNIVVVLMLYSIGTKEAFCVSVIRIFIVGILFGNLIGILYSLGGGFFIFFYFREKAVPRDRDSFFLDFLLDRGSKQCYYNKVYY